MRLSIIHGIFVLALGVNARAVVAHNDELSSKSQCDGKECSVALLSTKPRWTLHSRAIIFDPAEGAIAASEGEAGEAAGAASEAEAGAAGEASAIVRGGNDAGEGHRGSGTDGRCGSCPKRLAARAGEQTLITVEEYVAYLRKWYPNTDKYIQYSGYSVPQVKAFQDKNPGWYAYDDFFNTENKNSHWEKEWTAATRMDDAEASSKAISIVATEKITVFGAAHWETLGTNAFYAAFEAQINLDKVAAGGFTINHMARDATDASQIMATEDAQGVHYNAGYEDGTPNNTEDYATNREDTPQTNSERNSKRDSRSGSERGNSPGDSSGC